MDWKMKLRIKTYNFRHWLFYWGLDSEGDVTFRIAGVMNFTKYKEHTVFNWGRNICVEAAPKYLG